MRRQCGDGGIEFIAGLCLGMIIILLVWLGVDDHHERKACAAKGGMPVEGQCLKVERLK